MSNQVLDKIKDIQKELNELEVKKDLPQSQRVIASIVRLLDDSVSVDDQSLFQLFTDSDGKIRANASWFYEDSVMTDRKATYKVHPQNNLNLDIKLYGITKPSKRTIAWAQSLTPNFEDEPFNKNFNVGIDFIVPKSADRIIVVLSNNWVIRTLELKGKLTVTFQEILARWAEIKNFDNKTELHNILWESFDIQPLNKKFYSGISERFTLLRQYLVKEKVFDEKHASLFANRLLGRVIFCWFLDKKGIINPDQKYFDSESFENDNEYYKTKLERLFFGVLNTPIGDREFKDDVTPFLNGGLFEARRNDLYNDSKLSFPKNYFDDLFEFLSGYNFTTDESTSQFQQIAIDPEMLGRIFENLLAEMTEETGEQARKAKGAFYTPREIVDYMCKESLKEYLKTKIEKDEQLDQRLYQLIDAPDKDFQDQDHNWRRDWKPYKADILKALDELKVLDPACGSGAFPIGMLQLLVRVYERLEARFDSYKTKLGIIEKNIYGVDIEPMAVEIARLRAWLSIIVDEESDSKKIKPLPNLEFKFICANSLIDLDKNGSNTFGDDPELQEKLASIRDGYFNTESLNKKKKLRGDYEKLVTQGEGLFGESKKSKQLKTYRPFDNEAQAEFFDPKFMFGVNLFDVMVGNPPYLGEKGNKKIFDGIVESGLGSRFRLGKMDLFYYFFHLGLDVLKENGILSFITTNYFITATGAKKLIQDLEKRATVISMINFNEMKIFESALGQHNMVTVIQKGKTERKAKTAVTNRSGYLKKSESIIKAILVSEDPETDYFCVDQEDLFVNGVINLRKDKNNRLSIILDKVNDSTYEKLGELCHINKGFHSGCDKVTKSNLKKVNGNYGIGDGIFVVSKKELEAKKIENDISHICYKSSFINKYYSQEDSNPELFVIYTNKNTDINSYPNTKDHLSNFRPFLEMKREYKNGRLPWFSQHWPRDEDIFTDTEKIVLPYRSKTNLFSYIDYDFYASEDVLYIRMKDDRVSLKYILGILNSKLFYLYLYYRGKRKGETLELYQEPLSKLPINIATDELYSLVVENVEKIISNKKEGVNDNQELQGEIDKLIMEIYRLSPEDKEFVDNMHIPKQ